MKWWGIVLAIAALLIGGALLMYRAPDRTASIAFISPRGGEAWRPGETHAISWKATNVPSSDKITITIRRVPPPPLKEEGQEFDPIVFTDLPNTGSASWTIVPLYPDGTYVLGIAAYERIPVTGAITGESAPLTLSHPKLPDALYPLFKRVSWEPSVVESVTMGTTTFLGASVSSIPVVGTMDPGSIFSSFEAYYRTKLTAAGWKIDNALAAGGHVGGQTGYRKGSTVVLTGFRVLYHTVSSTSPSECPCDVTLSLFSSSVQ